MVSPLFFAHDRTIFIPSIFKAWLCFKSLPIVQVLQSANSERVFLSLRRVGMAAYQEHHFAALT